MTPFPSAADSAFLPLAPVDEERVLPPLAVFVSAHFRAQAAVFCWEPVSPLEPHSCEPEVDFRGLAAVCDSEEAPVCSALPRWCELVVHSCAPGADSRQPAAAYDSE